jgi:uncharacterized oxidoreductase
VAPWGGAGRRLGTNPHAIAVPGPDGVVAMSHDFASSVWAEGKLRVKFNRGEAVPPGIMLDGRGEPSTDPRRYYTEPPGSLLTAGAHKGFGLSIAVEILGGILSGAGAASGEPSVFRNGTLIVAVDPARFLPLADFHAQVAALMDWVRSAPLAAGATEIVIPGEPEARMERERRAAGVSIEDTTWRQIQSAAAEAGVDA